MKLEITYMLSLPSPTEPVRKIKSYHEFSSVEELVQDVEKVLNSPTTVIRLYGLERNLIGLLRASEVKAVKVSEFNPELKGYSHENRSQE